MKHDNWNYDIELSEEVYWLDADTCPECGGCIINASISQGIQFVGTDRKTAREKEYENGELYHSDDYMKVQLEYARCGSCDTLLYESE